MQVTPIVLKRDFYQLQAFWTAKGLPPVPMKCLPPTGLVVQCGGFLICGGFLVKSDTNLASICFVSANPLADPSVRSQALDLLLQGLVATAKRSGFEMVSVATNVPALQARYKRLGFIVTDENVKCFLGGDQSCLS